ncbi:MAG: 2-C-methyl-D-erythritol 4-phosphate cytidylyltransferase [Pseudomonadales bacterium]|nr:2-C-methyl-D-erythritol 4-phosphate cytidylyltransferase [Pseudomonadales bacterium]
MNYWLIVPAAGKGQRFGSHIPKQYLSLQNKTVMECTLNRLSQLTQISQIVVPIHPQDTTACTLSFENPKKITFCEGGVERFDSVLAGLEHIAAQANVDDWVLVHDVARPCVRLEDIQKLIVELQHEPVGGILAHPVRDTIKQANANSHIIATVPRQDLWQALTPQMFRFDVLYQALKHAKQQQMVVTDEASAVELLGYQPKLVIGSHDNLKITFPSDLLLAQYILEQQV